MEPVVQTEHQVQMARVALAEQMEDPIHGVELGILEQSILLMTMLNIMEADIFAFREEQINSRILKQRIGTYLFNPELREQARLERVDHRDQVESAAHPERIVLRANLEHPDQRGRTAATAHPVQTDLQV
jgi:hypothetical protein